MPESSMDKWPVEIKIVKMATSLVGDELTLYFISGVMSPEQCGTVKKRLPVASEFALESGQVVIATLVTHRQLRGAYEKFVPLAKEFRGQYYAVANAFVDACKDALGV